VNKLNPTVSVVIATLGGAQLSKTIATINAGSLVPGEILVCIPDQYSENLKNIEAPNIRVIATSFIGQVAQRAEGFRQAKEPLVMQLDDDVLIAPDALEMMTRYLLSLGRGHVIGPAIYNLITNEPLTKIDIGVSGFFHNLYASIVGGLPWGLRRMGALSRIGACGGVDPRFCGVEVFATDW